MDSAAGFGVQSVAQNCGWGETATTHTKPSWGVLGEGVPFLNGKVKPERN